MSPKLDVILNKFKSKYGQTMSRVDSIRLGIDPDNWRVGGLYY